MSDVNFYGEAHCGDCGETWEFEPMENGSLVDLDHDCPNDETEETT
ncbi:hypothetical protein [Streptomyces sp. NPDC059802]